MFMIDLQKLKLHRGKKSKIDKITLDLLKDGNIWTGRRYTENIQDRVFKLEWEG